jgi:hypothetical protein
MALPQAEILKSTLYCDFLETFYLHTPLRRWPLRIHVRRRGWLSAGFQTSADPRPPPPPPIRAQPVPQGFSRPSAADSRASFQVSHAAKTSDLKNAKSQCPCCYAEVPGNAAFCSSCGEMILLGGSVVQKQKISKVLYLVAFI